MAYGKLVFTPEEWREAAHKYSKELLMLPLFGCMETLDFMTGRPGVGYKESALSDWTHSSRRTSPTLNRRQT